MSKEIELISIVPPSVEDIELQKILDAMYESFFRTPPEFILCALCGGEFEPIENGIRCKECRNIIKVDK